MQTESVTLNMRDVVFIELSSPSLSVDLLLNMTSTPPAPACFRIVLTSSKYPVLAYPSSIKGLTIYAKTVVTKCNESKNNQRWYFCKALGPEVSGRLMS